MPIIIAGFCLLPLLIGIGAEYLVCRFLRRRLWRLLPPAATAAIAGIIAAGRWHIWRSEAVSPLTQILFVPILPAAFVLLGLFLGWRLWKRAWGPRVVKDK